MKARPRQSGFTLVEVLVSFAMAAAVMAGVFSCFTFVARNLAKLASYQALDTEGRRALAYLQQDLTLAGAVKAGTAPTASTVTLVLPAGEVVYSYDAGAGRLRRQATFGASPDLYLLNNSNCRCTSFAFSYYTGTGTAPTDQVNPAVYVPYSIKRIAVGFALESPESASTGARSRYELVSSRYLIRNKRPPDGT